MILILTVCTIVAGVYYLSLVFNETKLSSRNIDDNEKNAVIYKLSFVENIEDDILRAKIYEYIKNVALEWDKQLFRYNLINLDNSNGFLIHRKESTSIQNLKVLSQFANIFEDRFAQAIKIAIDQYTKIFSDYGDSIPYNLVAIAFFEVMQMLGAELDPNISRQVQQEITKYYGLSQREFDDFIQKYYNRDHSLSTEQLQMITFVLAWGDRDLILDYGDPQWLMILGRLNYITSAFAFHHRT